MMVSPDTKNLCDPIGKVSEKTLLKSTRHNAFPSIFNDLKYSIPTTNRRSKPFILDQRLTPKALTIINPP